MLFVGGTLPSTCSTPPPPFDDAVRSNDPTLAFGGHLHGASNIFASHTKQSKIIHHVSLTKNYHHDSVRWVNNYMF